MHIENFALQSKSSDTVSSCSAVKSVESVSCSATDSPASVVLHSILPVTVSQKGSYRKCHTYAFYDNGSSGCFLTEELFEDLQAAGNDTYLKLRTMHGTDHVKSIAVENLVVCDQNGDNPVDLPRTYTQTDIPVSSSQIPKPELLERWSHLKPVISQLSSNKGKLNIGLLIGNNCPTALEPLNVICSRDNGPYAMQLRHGWTVNGPLEIHSSSADGVVTCNRISAQESGGLEAFLPATIGRVFELEFHEHQAARYPDAKGPSHEDRPFLGKMERSLTLRNGHYEVALSFRQQNVDLPNNKAQAYSRPEMQIQKMHRDPADEASRELMVQELLHTSQRISGPAFPCMPETCWPQQPDLQMEEEVNVCHAIISEESAASDKRWSYSSDCNKLCRAVAIFRMLQRFLLCKGRKDVVPAFERGTGSTSNLEEAEFPILLYAHKHHFARELHALQSACERGRVPKDSPLYQLDPFLSTGLLRVGGDLLESNKHPIPITHKSGVADLIVRDIHRRHGYVGRKHVVAQIPERLCVRRRANVAVRRILHTCVVCRKLQAPVSDQRMADLLPERLTPDTPFTNCGYDNCGYDYFGYLPVPSSIFKSQDASGTCICETSVLRRPSSKLVLLLPKEDYMLNRTVI